MSAHWLAKMSDLLERSPMPAVGVAVFDVEQVFYSGVSGIANLRNMEPVTEAHLWDLASLTKTLITLPEVLTLVESGRLALDTPLGEQWLPATGRPIGQATLRQILAYDAGMPASVAFFRDLHGMASIMAAAMATACERPAGSGPVYSDLGAMICGALVEDFEGPLDSLAARRTGLRFNPLLAPVVATEDCAWRGQILSGDVHDENASAMGGVAGHAGAFGTLAQVTAAVQTWMHRTSESGTVWAEAVKQQSANAEGERYGLGWWLAPTRGLGGRDAGPRSWGCSGYVGNRIWVEPQREYAVVVLSNRVHPKRIDRKPYNDWCDESLSLASEVPRVW
jgi:CubicO group peptidase (beta-lactamase class C family)